MNVFMKLRAETMLVSTMPRQGKGRMKFNKLLSTGDHEYTPTGTRLK